MWDRKALTTEDVQRIFGDEILGIGGEISDTFDDGRALFARSILKSVCEVRPGDRVHGGVAVRVTDEDIWVHPYTFRLICKNGAIRAHALQARRIANAVSRGHVEVAGELRLAIRCSSARDAFQQGAREMRHAALKEADRVLEVLPLLARMGNRDRIGARLLSRILGRYPDGGDRSAFGLMNAVTSTARDTEDPELRWELETLGGAIGAAACDSTAIPVSDAWIQTRERTEEEPLLAVA